MQIVFTILLFLITVTSSRHQKNVYNPVSLFSFIWTLVFILTSMRLYDLNSASLYSYFLAFVGVLFFVIGCWIRRRFTIKQKLRIIDYSKDCTVNYSFLIVFYGVILLFTALLAATSISMIRSGISMATLRNTYDDVSSGMVIKSNAVYQFENYIVTTAEFAAVALLPVVFTDKTGLKKNIATIEMLLFLILHMFVTGARSFLIDIVILFFVYVLINRNLISQFQEYFKKVPKFIFIIIGVGAIALVAFMTTLRIGQDGSLLRQLYRYFSISMPLFDTHLGFLGQQQEYTYGWTMLYGVVRPWFSFLHNAGLPFPRGLEKALEMISMNNNFYPVGGGWANSFVTVFFYECMDFGVIGIPIFSCLYGVVAETYYLRMMDSPNRRNQALYLLVAIGLFLSFARQFYTAFRYVYAFAIICLAFKTNKNNRKV